MNYSSSNYFISGGDASARDRFYNLVAKIDRNLTDRQHLSIRYGQNDRREMRTYNGIFDKPGADGQLPLRRANWTGAVDWTGTMSTTTVLDVRVSMSRFIDLRQRTRTRTSIWLARGFALSGFAAAAAVVSAHQHQRVQALGRIRTSAARPQHLRCNLR